MASHLNGQLGLSWLELALETGWSRILTDLQKVRAAEADGKHFSLSGSLFVINASAQLRRES